MTCADALPLLSQRLDGVLPRGIARRLDTHLSACPGCRAVVQAMEAEQRMLAEHWPVAAAPTGFTERVVAGLPARRRASLPVPWTARRRLPALAGALVLVLFTASVAVPPVRAGLGLFLRHVILRESDPPARQQYLGPFPLRTLEEAQQRVPWRIRVPTALPDGYRLLGAVAEEVHDGAIGPTVILYYQRGDDTRAPSLRISQLRTSSQIEEPVAPGAASTVRVGGREARLIDGMWVEEDGRETWQHGTLLRLILEDGDLIIQLEADPHDGWTPERLITVAASLR